MRLRVKSLFENLTLLIIGSVFATQALAFESLLGDYRGKITMLEGYGDHVDDPCSVTLATSDLYGGAISFEIRGLEKLSVEKRRVESDLKSGRPVVKWISPGSSNKPVEIVVLNLREDGSLRSVRLMLKDSLRHQDRFIVCDELVRGS
jgi:hypothetical protein